MCTAMISHPGGLVSRIQFSLRMLDYLYIYFVFLHEGCLRETIRYLTRMLSLYVLLKDYTTVILWGERQEGNFRREERVAEGGILTLAELYPAKS